MLALMRKTRVPRGAQLIDEGRVGCLVSGSDVDVDRCFGCSAFVRVVQKSGDDASYMVCKPASGFLRGYVDFG